VLRRALGVLDLVGDGATMLTASAMTPVVATVLAAAAGFSQLFSP
jgi:hypothetical protein